MQTNHVLQFGQLVRFLEQTLGEASKKELEPSEHETGNGKANAVVAIWNRSDGDASITLIDALGYTTFVCLDYSKPITTGSFMFDVDKPLDDVMLPMVHICQAVGIIPDGLIHALRSGNGF